MQETEKKTSRWKAFWRIQKECFRRAITPYMMYLIMSMLLLVCQTLASFSAPLMFILSTICILGGMAYNAHLCFLTGQKHLDAYIAGELHRKNALFGIRSGGDHQPEREYRPYKGFVIGFYVGIPVLVFGSLAGAFPALEGPGLLALIMFAGWAIIPVRWLNVYGGLDVSNFLSLAMIAIPVVVSGIFYIVGAKVQAKKRSEREERMEEAKGKKGKK